VTPLQLEKSVTVPKKPAFPFSRNKTKSASFKNFWAYEAIIIVFLCLISPMYSTTKAPESGIQVSSFVTLRL
jgi:hypothetical protein